MTKSAYFYDQEADILYVNFAPGEQATAAVELNENILLRWNRSEKRAIGLTFNDYSVLVQLTRYGPRAFPLTGLLELEPEWQDMVIEIITTPPVNEFLKLSAYAASFIETVPVAAVEKPSLAFAV